MLPYKRQASETGLSGLYYPFSRCIDDSSLKQMLLVFNTVYFLDPVDDEAWRAKLYQQLENVEDARFHKYRRVYSAFSDLMREGVVARIDPRAFPNLTGNAVAASALSDVLDSAWAHLASRPQDFGLPHGSLSLDGRPTWQAFIDKLPTGFVEALTNRPELRQHLVRKGRGSEAWTLSYAAGSAAATSVHLAAAEQLNIAPITDSVLHHQLLLRKVLRNEPQANSTQPLSPAVIQQLTTTIAVALVSDLVPDETLRRASFDDILAFRDKSRGLRTQFARDIVARLGAIKETPAPEHLAVAAAQISNALDQDVRIYRAELRSVRDKVWPMMPSALAASLGAGGLAAVSMSYIGGQGYAVAASIAAASLSLLKSALDLRAEQRKIEGAAAPAVAYLSQVAQTFL